MSGLFYIPNENWKQSTIITSVFGHRHFTMKLPVENAEYVNLGD
jgi:hypothetical protein